MATTIEQDTKEITFAGSPQFIYVNDDGNAAVAADNFYIDIRVWTGLKASIPTPASYALYLPAELISGILTKTSFEISKFISEFIDSNDYVVSGGTVYNGSNAVWYNYEVSADNGAAVITSPTRLALDGYGYYEDGVNPGTTVAAENGKVFCEQSTKLIYAENTEYIIPVYIGDTSTNAEVQSVAGGDQTIAVDYGFTLNSTDSAEQIAYINLGKNQFTTAWAVGKTLDYKINNVGSTSSIEDYEAIIDCTRGKEMSLKYLNSCGSISNLPVNGKEELSLSINRTNYRNSPLTSVFTYDDTEHIDKTFEVNGTRRIAVTTGWVYEESDNMIKDLLVSKYVWLEYGATTYPVQIKDTNKKIFNRTWESQIGYDFILEVATPLINKVL